MVVNLPQRFYELKKLVHPYTDKMGQLTPNAPVEIQKAKQEMIKIAKQALEF